MKNKKLNKLFNTKWSENENPYGDTEASPILYRIWLQGKLRDLEEIEI